MSRPTIKDVAKLSGYGVGTVSRVISNDKSVSDKARRTILAAIEQLHFIPNINGVRLKRQYSQIIAILVPVINHPFFAEFVEELEHEALKKDYSLLLLTSQNSVEKENEIFLKIKRKEIDGAIFVTHYEHSEDQFKGYHLVSIDRHLSDDIPIITSNNYEASYQAIEQLVLSGAKKIGFIGGKPMVESEVNLRYQAYLDVIKKYQLKAYDLFEIIEHGNEDQFADKFINLYPDVDAIFVSGFTLSEFVYHKFKQKGVKFPQDKQLVSYDGSFSKVGYCTISAIAQPIKEMAKEAFDTLYKLIQGESVEKYKNIIDCHFIKGETTK
ncbi:MAG: LacI family DNA-binding transcriptional regulator [Bacilli bacterium]|nr:LacI family DNA-binding transcriptional regulator [Bacilli bacterium]